jgi:hypothetical protein
VSLCQAENKHRSVLTDNSRHAADDHCSALLLEMLLGSSGLRLSFSGSFSQLNPPLFFLNFPFPLG